MVNVFRKACLFFELYSFFARLFSLDRSTGRGAAWLARLVRDQEVASSNLAAPTTSVKSITQRDTEEARSDTEVKISV